MINYKIAFLIFASSAVFIRIPEEAAATQKEGPEIIQLRPGAEYISAGARDPFEPYLKKEDVNPAQPQEEKKEEVVNPPALAVQGVMWGSDTPLAIVNNRVVKKDDVIDGARVVDINKDGVTVFFVNRQYIVPAPAGANSQSAQVKTESAVRNQGADR